VTYLLSNVGYCPDVVKSDDIHLSQTTLQLDIQKLASDSSGPRNTLNTMPIIIRIFLLLLVNNVLYPNKIFKNETIL